MLRRQIRETVEEAGALAEQIAAEERALKLQKDELAANERLLEQGYVQKTRLLTLQRAVAEYEARHSERRAELSKSRQRASELEFRILPMRNTYVQTATDELKEATSRMFDLEERIRPSRDASERQKITAPIAGEVVGLRVFNAGSVIGPREVLMEIVPQEKRLIVEARIRPEDINHVRAGSEADIRLTAYQSRTTPLVRRRRDLRLGRPPGRPAERRAVLHRAHRRAGEIARRRQPAAAGRHAGRGLHPHRQPQRARLPARAGDVVPQARDAGTGLMRLLFVHQNFPGQYRHLAAHYAATPATGSSRSARRRTCCASRACPGVELLGYDLPELEKPIPSTARC